MLSLGWEGSLCIFFQKEETGLKPAHSINYSFIYLFIHLFICLFIYLLVLRKYHNFIFLTYLIMSLALHNVTQCSTQAAEHQTKEQDSWFTRSRYSLVSHVTVSVHTCLCGSHSHYHHIPFPFCVPFPSCPIPILHVSFPVRTQSPQSPWSIWVTTRKKSLQSFPSSRPTAPGMTKERNQHPWQL